MYVITVDNVRQAFPKALEYLLLCGKKEPSRGGDVRAAAEPVTIHYRKPKQHVLLNPVRDANPFFHLMEAMWMLAGRNDSAFLDRYIHDFGERFAINGIVEDAYGFRWRRGLLAFEGRIDQLAEIIKQLKADPSTRQCVLQMWGAGRFDLVAKTARPCNLVATFRIRNGHLNMSVHNRSNDLVWGACGANAVHFALLQEYIAEMVGVPLGEYWQISDNLHIYVDQIKRLEKKLQNYESSLVLNLGEGSERPYGDTLDLVTDTKNFDEELEVILGILDNVYRNKLTLGSLKALQLNNIFLSRVVRPMALAHWFHKQGAKEEALEWMAGVGAGDWREAGRGWLERRNVRQ